MSYAGAIRWRDCAQAWLLGRELARLNDLKPPHYLLKVGQDLRVTGCRCE